MAQNIIIGGTIYSDVPAITVPKVGGGYASFTDGGGGGSPMVVNVKAIWDGVDTLVIGPPPSGYNQYYYGFYLDHTTKQHYRVCGSGIISGNSAHCVIGADYVEAIPVDNLILTVDDYGILSIEDEDGVLSDWFGDEKDFDISVQLLVFG